MTTPVNNLLDQAKAEIEAIKTKNELLNLKSRYLGSDSDLQKGLKSLKELPAAKRASQGKLLNSTKQALEQLFASTLTQLVEQRSYPPIDISAPGVMTNKGNFGSLHPATQMLKQTYEVFTELGFAIVDSNEIETDWYNFEALNMPPSHPARDMQDTFYIDNGKMDLLPRTHTSGMQIRFMENNEPPYKIIVPGKVFRNEDEDATHSWIFNQVEGLVVGEGVSMADLKGTLLRVVQRLLGEEAEIRFRPSYFPYTEPSVELDAKYKGKWLELGGAGMVHPSVLRNGGVDPEKYSGFAFGWGPERFAVIKYGLDDIRQLWRPNLRYLAQF